VRKVYIVCAVHRKQLETQKQERGFEQTVPTIALQNCTFSFLHKKQLIKLKLRTMRSGVWFRTLSRIDRVLFDLTIKIANNIRSTTLAKNILEITRKLESGFSRAFIDVGFPLAQKLSFIAQKWGNPSTKSWACTVSFINFLAVMHINNPKTFKPQLSSK
jgi:hypothetical protein